MSNEYEVKSLQALEQALCTHKAGEVLRYVMGDQVSLIRVVGNEVFYRDVDGRSPAPVESTVRAAGYSGKIQDLYAARRHADSEGGAVPTAGGLTLEDARNEILSVKTPQPATKISRIFSLFKQQTPDNFPETPGSTKSNKLQK